MDKSTLLVSRRGVLLGSAALAGTQVLPALGASPSAVSAMIDSTKTRAPISPMIYGGFLEHIGNLINYSLWSEVLDDRKFYYGVVASQEPKPEDRRAAMRYINKWLAVGPIKAFSLDTENAYVGKHSPAIKLAGSRKRGVVQKGLALAAEKTYSGHLVMASDKPITVAVNLRWGEGNNERQTVELNVEGDWQGYNFAFDPLVSTTQATLEITARGRGVWRLGASSMMPDDNIHGFRADTTALMRDMDCKILRIPGGNFISAYDWKDTIGDRDKRPPVYDPVWKSVQPNDVGVDELLTFCELIECEPYWAVNSGFGEPRSGAELVEYVNGDANTTWGAKRKANGRSEPYGVKYWSIGNEMYGHWQFGHMSREQYVVKHNLFAEAMRAVDPSIYLLAPGGFVDEMTTGQGIFIEGQPEVEVGSERDWAFGMLQHCWGNFDALSTHAYPPQGKRFDLKTGKLFDVDMSLLEWARQPANRIRTMVDAWEEYKKHFPKLHEGNIKVFFDEWAYHFDDDLKGTLAIALAFHEFFRHTDFIDMAGYTMATGWLDYNRTESVIGTRGTLFQLYNQFYGSIPVAVDGNVPQPKPQYPIGGDQPRVNSGSETYPLDVAAALTADKQTLVVAVVNATESEQVLALGIQGFKAAATGRCWKFTGNSLGARIQVGEVPGVFLTEREFNTSAESFKVPATTIELYHFPLA